MTVRSVAVAARAVVTALWIVDWMIASCVGEKPDRAWSEPYCLRLASSNFEAVSCKPDIAGGMCAGRAAGVVLTSEPEEDSEAVDELEDE